MTACAILVIVVMITSFLVVMRSKIVLIRVTMVIVYLSGTPGFSLSARFGSVSGVSDTAPIITRRYEHPSPGLSLGGVPKNPAILKRERAPPRCIFSSRNVRPGVRSPLAAKFA